MAYARAHRVLPGFGLSLGFTLAYLSLIVLVPLAAVSSRLPACRLPPSGRR